MINFNLAFTVCRAADMLGCLDTIRTYKPVDFGPGSRRNVWALDGDRSSATSQEIKLVVAFADCSANTVYKYLSDECKKAYKSCNGDLAIFIKLLYNDTNDDTIAAAMATLKSSNIC